MRRGRRRGAAFGEAGRYRGSPRRGTVARGAYSRSSCSRALPRKPAFRQAELAGADDDERLGTRQERRQRAATALELALDADPESVVAAGRLATVLLEQGRAERLVSSFRAALGYAKSPEAVILLGSEIARVARDELHDLPVAISAMRQVRAVAPQHVPSLLTLAELCIGQRVWPEAVDALEAVVSTSRETAPTLTALFALASIYEKVLSRDSEVDRVVRAALAVDPKNSRALRALLRRLAPTPHGEDEATHRARRKEIAELLGRLAEVEADPEQKNGHLARAGRRPAAPRGRTRGRARARGGRRGLSLECARAGAPGRILPATRRDR